MLLVTGATGNVGRELVRELDEAGVRFRVLVRGAAGVLPDHVERVVADLGSPAALGRAFEGVERLFLLTPGIGLEHAENAVAAAKSAGVRHIVHLSSFNVLGDPMPAMGRWHHEREELIRGSGIAATFLRPGGFMTNAFDWLPTIRDGRYVPDPISPGRYAPIDPADIAAVAALVLRSDEHFGSELVLTGDEPLSLPEQVGVLAEATGLDIEVRPVASLEEAVASRFPNGAPPALADAIIEGFALLRQDTAGFRTDTVERLLGREPLTFADWCARNADAFREAIA
ncbi:NAD(P)H-binding protein [Actinomadura rupiterrae]|uniref:NAD(P)H-binding protein n=1 Tax=Actinomadura rupiterrae TaxID=559627 RepID=UPI0020A4D788|nr:NAD(P)H-binding protein [Actinomadura rupiterrae]MCP2338456.1 uncharacterized protein YbjT (DUF2867 family) [Actinomadura rupiterrae]